MEAALLITNTAVPLFVALLPILFLIAASVWENKKRKWQVFLVLGSNCLIGAILFVLKPGLIVPIDYASYILVLNILAVIYFVVTWIIAAKIAEKMLEEEPVVSS